MEGCLPSLPQPACPSPSPSQTCSPPSSPALPPPPSSLTKSPTAFKSKSIARSYISNSLEGGGGRQQVGRPGRNQVPGIQLGGPIPDPVIYLNMWAARTCTGGPGRRRSCAAPAAPRCAARADTWCRQRCGSEPAQGWAGWGSHLRRMGVYRTRRPGEGEAREEGARCGSESSVLVYKPRPPYPHTWM